MEPVNQPVQPIQPPSVPTDPVPVQTETQPKPTPTQKNGFLVTLLSILLLLAVAAAGFFAYQTQNLVKQMQELKVASIQPTSVPSPKPSTDPTSDWEIYENSKFGFSFKFPKEWGTYFSETENKSFNLFVAPLAIIKEISDLFERGGGFGGGKFLTLTINKLEEAPSYKSDEYQKVSSETLILDGISGIRYHTDVILDMQGFDAGDKIETIVVKTSNGYFIIGLLDYQYKNLFDQILSTFSFTE
ncbi:hypothetical protein ISR94_02080 [Candidatus Microgenomates bacterium]|nr:hypothetical protein [Candidatus Microgenomates bacterium]